MGYVEKEIISKRFILAVMVIGGYLVAPDRVPPDAAAAVLIFYFAAHKSGV